MASAERKGRRFGLVVALAGLLVWAGGCGDWEWIHGSDQASSAPEPGGAGEGGGGASGGGGAPTGDGGGVADSGGDTTADEGDAPEGNPSEVPPVPDPAPVMADNPANRLTLPAEPVTAGVRVSVPSGVAGDQIEVLSGVLGSAQADAAGTAQVPVNRNAVGLLTALGPDGAIEGYGLAVYADGTEALVVDETTTAVALVLMNPFVSSLLTGDPEADRQLLDSLKGLAEVQEVARRFREGRKAGVDLLGGGADQAFLDAVAAAVEAGVQAAVGPSGAPRTAGKVKLGTPSWGGGSVSVTVSTEPSTKVAAGPNEFFLDLKVENKEKRYVYVELVGPNGEPLGPGNTVAGAVVGPSSNVISLMSVWPSATEIQFDARKFANNATKVKLYGPGQGMASLDDPGKVVIPMAATLQTEIVANLVSIVTGLSGDCLINLSGNILVTMLNENLIRNALVDYARNGSFVKAGVYLAWETLKAIVQNKSDVVTLTLHECLGAAWVTAVGELMDKLALRMAPGVGQLKLTWDLSVAAVEILPTVVAVLSSPALVEWPISNYLDVDLRVTVTEGDPTVGFSAGCLDIAGGACEEVTWTIEGEPGGAVTVTSSRGEMALHTFAQPGTYTVKASTRDDAGASQPEPGKSLDKTFTVTISPRVVRVDPADGAADVETDAEIALYFDRPLDPATVTDRDIVLSEREPDKLGGAPVQVAVTYNPAAAVVQVTPKQRLLENRVYRVEVGHLGLITGESGEPIVPFSAEFGSRDTIPPRVNGVEPLGGWQVDAADIPRPQPIAITFSEAIDPDTVTPESFYVTTDTGDRVPGTVRLDPAFASIRSVYEFVPAAPLEKGRVYTATVTTAVTDLAGNPLGSSYSWRFVTAEDPLDALGGVSDGVLYAHVKSERVLTCFERYWQAACGTDYPTHLTLVTFEPRLLDAAARKVVNVAGRGEELGYDWDRWFDGSARYPPMSASPDGKWLQMGIYWGTWAYWTESQFSGQVAFSQDGLRLVWNQKARIDSQVTVPVRTALVEELGVARADPVAEDRHGPSHFGHALSPDGTVSYYTRLSQSDWGWPEIWAVNLATGNAERAWPPMVELGAVHTDRRWVDRAAADRGDPEIVLESLPDLDLRTPQPCFSAEAVENPDRRRTYQTGAVDSPHGLVYERGTELVYECAELQNAYPVLGDPENETAPEGARFLQVSKDGAWLYFKQGNVGYRVKPGTEEPAEILYAASGYGQCVSPDGQWVAFDHGGDIYLLGLGTGKVTRLTADGNNFITSPYCFVPKDWGSADTDGDGYSDREEIELGTSGARADTDADGLEDPEEITLGTDPVARDTDGDGLPDGQEFDPYGTDPLDPDTDGDGVWDGAEVAVGLDPLDPSEDADGDGIPNELEWALGTEPNLADSDGDGIDDIDEWLDRLSPGNPDSDGDGLEDGRERNGGWDPANPETDHDGDGVPTVDEIAAGTDPTSEDTDGDGLSDLVETATGVFVGPEDTGTNPLNADSDLDGLPDGEEVAGDGTDPNRADTDGDGVGDGDEKAAGFDPLVFDPDHDADGVETLVEVSVGTDPLDPTDKPSFLGYRWAELPAVPAFLAEDGVQAAEAWVAGDDGYVVYGLPFPFPFYGVTTDVVTLDTNGSIRPFDYDESEYGLRMTGEYPDRFIGPWNADLSSAQFGRGVEVQAKTGPDRVVVHWNTETYSDAGSGRLNDFEAVLYPSGHIVFRYLRFDQGADEDSGSGISSGNGTDYVSLTDDVGPVYTLADRAFVFEPVLANDADGDGLPDAEESARGTDPGNPDSNGDGIKDGWHVHLLGDDPLNPDTDGDGIPNADEAAAGTSPISADTDGDGITDPEEGPRGTDPLLEDTDGDGVGDGAEVAAGFSPLSADADHDGDGVPSLDEASRGTDPLSPDTDADGLGDATETGTGVFAGPADTGTDPTVADTDGDGLADGAEVTQGTDPLVEDTDADGSADGTEAALGTSPLSAADAPVRWAAALRSEGPIRIQAAAVADFTGDGLPDLGVVSDRVAGTSYVGSWWEVMPGDGSGGFGRGTAMEAPTTSRLTDARAVAAGDLDGDGDLDAVLAVPGSLSSSIVPLWNDGTGSMSPGTALEAPRYASAVWAADADGDGAVDLVVSDDWGGTVTVFWNDGAGGFGASTSVAVGVDDTLYAETLAVGDLNGDGVPDLAYASDEDARIGLVLGDGARGFGPVSTLAGSGAQVDGLAAADLNADGRTDLVALYGNANGKVAVWFQTEGGELSEVVSVEGLDWPGYLAVADLDGRLGSDVAVMADGIQVFLNDGTGALWPAAGAPDALWGLLFAKDLGGAPQSDLMAVGRDRADGTVEVRMGSR